jgi:hypothetical protein
MTNLGLAIAAWSAVRNSDDAVWDALPMGIKAKLVDLAGKYRGGAKVAEGDYPPEGFAEKVYELAVTAGPRIPIFNSSKNATARIGTPFGFVEHEDTRILSPNPEDVDPLKSLDAVGPEASGGQGKISLETPIK